MPRQCPWCKVWYKDTVLSCACQKNKSIDDILPDFKKNNWYCDSCKSYIPYAHWAHMCPWPRMEPKRSGITWNLKDTWQWCLRDNLSEEDKKKPMWLSCPCPKCTTQC